VQAQAELPPIIYAPPPKSAEELAKGDLPACSPPVLFTRLALSFMRCTFCALCMLCPFCFSCLLLVARSLC
jgi:hypothetical protein